MLARMKIGLAPLADAETIGDIARAAEAAGFHSLWVPEHVVLFDEDQYRSRYPYTDDGRLRVGAEPAILDPLLTLGYLAGITSTIRLGTGICLLPQRNPVYSAKEVATADQLSGGRVDFGVGIGWLREEFAALQVPWPNRAGRTAEYVKVLQTLWMDPVSEFEGEFYSLPPVRQYPKPVQKPHPPIIFGGESDAALQRVAAMGQGWYGYDLGIEEATERIGVLKGMLDANGRSPAEIEISVNPFRRRVDPDTLAQYREAGADQVILNIWGSRALPEGIAALGKELADPVRPL
jgi:probable F420-dependent oxidoreductase